MSRKHSTHGVHRNSSLEESDTGRRLPFSRRYARLITRFRWPIVALWLALTMASMLWLPKLDTVVAHTRTNYLPPNSSVVEGQNLLNEVNPHNVSQSTAVVTLHNPNGLTSTDKQYFKGMLSSIERNQSKYGVNKVQDLYNTDKRFASSFLSEDGTTEIALVGFPRNELSDATVSAIQRLQSAFTPPPSDAKVYFTGDAPIEQDNAHILQQSVQKTAGVTIALVLIILILTFRSLITPFVTLLAVGLSVLISSGVVAWLAQRGLPASSFTQTFLIAVLFGAGTDYSIIIMNRFREELMRDHIDQELAIANSLKAISKTVIFSASTVIVSFAVLYLARFGLYRSAVGVGLGVTIVLLTCLTLIPSLMSLLGPLMYWPIAPNPGTADQPSAIWVRTSLIATRRPWWTLFALLFILIPISFLFTDQRTFNPMDDIPNAPSVEGFRTVAKAFGPGRAMPMQIVLHTSKNLRTPEGLTTIEHMSHATASLSSVSQVDSATRPTGAVISEFQIANQNRKAAEGLGQIQETLYHLQSQLSVAQATQRAMFSQQKLQSLAAALQQLEQGTGRMVQELSQSLTVTGQLVRRSNQLSQSAQQLAQNAASLGNAISAWAQKHPGTSGTPQWNRIVQLIQAQQQGTHQFAAAGNQVNQAADQLASELTRLSSGAGQVDQQLTQVVGDASKQVPNLTHAVSGASRLLPGLNQAVPGVGQIHSGVAQVRDYLTASGGAVTHGDPGYYIPSSTVTTNPELLKAMNAYISPDGHVAKFTIVLKSEPYSTTAIRDVPSIQHAAQVALAGSPLHDGQIYAVGTTPLQAELNNISSRDFARTVSLILTAIFILLVLMLRSIITPLYIILSLSGTYVVTMGLLQSITHHILNKPGLSWPVPFFVFLLLVALGVDYSIFLMSRFEEEMARGMAPKQAIQVAMGHMGKVVFSGAIIMAGTFGSMTVAGVSSLVEIGISIIIGLVIYLTLILGFFVPACASVFGWAHFWPFVGDRNLARVRSEVNG